MAFSQWTGLNLHVLASWLALVLRKGTSGHPAELQTETVRGQGTPRSLLPVLAGQSNQRQQLVQRVVWALSPHGLLADPAGSVGGGPAGAAVEMALPAVGERRSTHLPTALTRQGLQK